MWRPKSSRTIEDQDRRVLLESVCESDRITELFEAKRNIQIAPVQDAAGHCHPSFQLLQFINKLEAKMGANEAIDLWYWDECR